jgi:hypothetical protein
VLSGELRVRSFDFRANFRSDGQLSLRLVRDSSLHRSGVSTLSRKYGNVHELIAGPEGARWLDVFTYFDRDAESHYLNITSNSHGEPGYFTATWAAVVG